MSNDPIPYASVYLNSENSQKVVRLIRKSENNGEGRTDREYVGWAYEFSRNTHGAKNVVFGNNQEPSITRGNVELGGELLRVGKYYYTPELYSKVKRAYSGSTGRGKVNSLHYNPRDSNAKHIYQLNPIGDSNEKHIYQLNPIGDSNAKHRADSL